MNTVSFSSNENGVKEVKLCFLTENEKISELSCWQTKMLSEVFFTLKAIKIFLTIVFAWKMFFNGKFLSIKKSIHLKMLQLPEWRNYHATRAYREQSLRTNDQSMVVLRPKLLLRY